MSCGFQIFLGKVRPFTSPGRGPSTGSDHCSEHGEGVAYLRREGLYSSLISEWRRLRDAGVLEGKDPGAKVGRPSAEQAEIGRLRRELADRERRLATTETALEIMGKAHALLEQISESAETEQPERPRRKR